MAVAWLLPSKSYTRTCSQIQLATRWKRNSGRCSSLQPTWHITKSPQYVTCHLGTWTILNFQIKIIIKLCLTWYTYSAHNGNMVTLCQEDNTKFPFLSVENVHSFSSQKTMVYRLNWSLSLILYSLRAKNFLKILL